MKIKIVNPPSIDDYKKALVYINKGIINGAFKHLATKEPYNKDIVFEWHKKSLNGTPQIGALVNGTCVGMAHIDVEHGRRSVNGYLAITVNPEYQNNKIGEKLIASILLEAQKIGLVRITAEPCSDNQRAINFLKKNGFKEEGIMKCAFINDEGRLIDRLIMRIEITENCREQCV